MKVTINERDYEYISDYPHQWIFSARDHFKFPVIIGYHQCFIKRFEKQTADDISGWALMQSLKRRNESNLPNLFDIVSVKEKGRDVYYIFYKCLNGDTLDKLITGGSNFDLEKLITDLFKALHAVHLKGFWFADFCEKNIFCEEDGRFLLVDLDSAQPISRPPDREMYGSKEYWGLVFNFYREIVQQRNLKPDDINGGALNYLQLVFLLLKLKIFSNGNYQYNSSELYNLLPAILYKQSPAFKEIYAQVFRNRQISLQLHDIENIKRLSFEILSSGIAHVAVKSVDEDAYKTAGSNSSKLLPAVHQFSLLNYDAKEDDIYYVSSGEPFKLTWNVENASTLELYRNAAFFRTLNIHDQSVELKEGYDGRESDNEFKLVAGNGNGRSDNKIIRFQVTRPINEPVINALSISGYTTHTGDDYEVNSGEYFTLNWKIKNVQALEIYRNGVPYRTLNPTDETIRLKEVYDGSNKKIEYTLQASANDFITVSNAVNVLIKKKTVIELPEIFSFKTDIANVSNNHPFNLQWSVKGATGIELMRNGTSFKKISPSNQAIQLQESFEGKKSQVEYTLLVTNTAGEVKSKPLKILIENKTQFNWSLYLKIAGAVVGIVALFLLIKVLIPAVRPETTISNVEPQNLYEDSTITVHGTKFSDAKKIQVYFNDLEGTIQSTSNESIVVRIPDLKNNIFVKGIVTVNIKANSYSIYSQNFHWFDKNTVAVKNISLQNFNPQNTVTIYGNNLNAPNIKVSFNNMLGNIITKTKDSLLIAAPESIVTDSTTSSITLIVSSGYRTVYRTTFTP